MRYHGEFWQAIEGIFDFLLIDIILVDLRHFTSNLLNHIGQRLRMYARLTQLNANVEYLGRETRVEDV